jgi:hypothetical protein
MELGARTDEIERGGQSSCSPGNHSNVRHVIENWEHRLENGIGRSEFGNGRSEFGNGLLKRLAKCCNYNGGK